MSQNFTRHATNQAGFAPATEASIYTHPEEVASDSKLTLTEKREVLASWISDARAVENAPSLRRLDSGAVVDVDAILSVLVSLDSAPEPRDRKKRSILPRRQGVVMKWLNRISPPPSANDNDDDPPPAPAGLVVPFPPPTVAAHSARAANLARLAAAWPVLSLVAA